ncbi:hypothetical protein LRS03_03255 [Rhizobacter sp. J219]|uniref:hypothetical protein n=1 Tax=Rhizobacter sp. J219 TaxID=2898430 RepID=UPI002150EEE4|nr:hypothetical protein [Rhizobacter sp. J219]MCR5881929.1 hypothetical protein [Rhizobacter sp. J219]
MSSSSANIAAMLKELFLIGIVVIGGLGVSRLWVTHRRLQAVLLCLAVALCILWLARRWHIDLSGVA